MHYNAINAWLWVGSPDVPGPDYAVHPCRNRPRWIVMVFSDHNHIGRFQLEGAIQSGMRELHTARLIRRVRLTRKTLAHP
jgi:hypothetical protein